MSNSDQMQLTSACSAFRTQGRRLELRHSAEVADVLRGCVLRPLGTTSIFRAEKAMGAAMAFIFDEHTAPDIKEGRQSVRFCMVDGDERATCQIGCETLNDLGPEDIETDREFLDRFLLYRGPIATAAARLLAAGAHKGGTIIQIMRANLA